MAKSIKLGSDTYLDSQGVSAKLYINTNYSASVPTATTTRLCTFNVPNTGVWQITSIMDCASTISGNIIHGITAPSASYMKAVRSPGSDGGGSVHTVTLKLTQGAEVGIYGYQASGSTVTLRTHVTAMCLAGESH